ncbi:MAG: hypothetical protein NT074_00470, partial [Methanomicrobiales archaeon]|nr:hypothetical protein [Methanomicrobiales archaeon]
GIGFSGEKPHQGGTIYPLDECPFSMAHKDGAYAIQFGNGAIFAGCHHNSCGGGQQRWQELREKYEPDRHAKWKEWEEKEKQWNRERGRLRAERDGILETAARHVEGPQPAMSEGGQGPGTAPATPLPSGANANSTHGGEPATPQKSTHADLQGGVPASTPAHVSNDLPGKEEALALLKCGDPVKEMLACFAKDHVGDEVVAECLILSLASRSVLNTNGLHVSVTGESGKGKSHTFSTMLKQVPPRYRLSCRMSNKALFYIDDLQPGTAIVFDDTTLSDEMGEILKGVTTSFREPFLYRTVTKDRRGQICTIPERCVWWVAKVEGVGDDQVFNRMLTCWIDDTIEQDGRVLNQILLRDAKVPEQKQEVRDDVLICQMMWENLGQQMIYVVIPYAPQIRFQASSNRRNPEMLLDLIKANAAMRLLQREKIEVEGVSCISATQDDFDRAVRLYGLLNGTSGGQTTKLTKREADLLAVIIQHKWPEFTIPMLQKVTGLSNASIFKAIHGYDSRGTSYTGLLEKCPAIAYTDRTVVCEVDQVTGYSTRRRSNAYTFDRDLYLTWCAGGYVWIDAQIDPDSNPSAPSATFCNPTELSVGIENEIKSSIAEDLSTNTHMYLGTCVSYGKFENTQNNDHHPVQESSSLCESEFSVGQIAISPDQSGIDELNSQKGAGACGTSSRVAEGQNAKLEDRGDFDECDVLQGVQSYGKEYITAVGFDPHHFKKLDSLDSRPCSSCGKKGDSWHIEKITPRRRKDPSVEPYTLCRRCWQKTVRKHQETCIPLPGMISIESLEEVRNEIGRCSICNLEKAMWRDRSRDVKVCEYCYQRLARVEGCGVVGG